MKCRHCDYKGGMFTVCPCCGELVKPWPSPETIVGASCLLAIIAERALTFAGVIA